MEINQKITVARSALYEKDYTTLAKLVVENQVGGDSVVSEYILQHENGLFVLQDNFWLQFEKEIIALENLEVPDIQFHKEYARQYIKYGADIIDNNPELSWRLWLCLWVARFHSLEQVTTTMAFIMEMNGVGAFINMRSNWITPASVIDQGEQVRVSTLAVTSIDTKTRVYGDWREWLIPQPLSMRAALQPVTVRTCAQMLQSVFVRPPDRVMQLLGLPRYTSPIGTEV